MKKKFSVFIVVIICLLQLGCGRELNNNAVIWNPDTVTTEGVESMYFFSSEQCGYCEKIKEKHLNNKKITSFLNKSFNCINIIQGDEQAAELMNRFNVTAFPTFLFLNTSGAEKSRITGYLEEDAFLNRLKEIKDGVDTLEYFLEKNRLEGGGYLLEIFNVYVERKDSDNIEASAERIRTEAPELYKMRQEYILTSLTEAMYANRKYEDFIPEMQTLLSYKVERMLRNDYLKTATAYSRSGRYDEASDIHLLLMKLLPDDITVYTDYLRFLAVNNLQAEPSADIEDAAALGWDDFALAEYYYWLSRYYKVVGDPVSSDAAMAEAVHLEPERYSVQQEQAVFNGVGAFTVSSHEIVFPDTKEGSLLTAELEVSNNSADNIEIDIISTCSCLTVPGTKLLLNPGESAPVSAVLDTTGESGLIERSLIFRRNGAHPSEQVVSLRVTVN